MAPVVAGTRSPPNASSRAATASPSFLHHGHVLRRFHPARSARSPTLALPQVCPLQTGTSQGAAPAGASPARWPRPHQPQDGARGGLTSCVGATRRADELRWRAVEDAVKEVLSPMQPKDFLKAVEDVASKVRRHGTRVRRGGRRARRIVETEKPKGSSRQVERLTVIGSWWRLPSGMVLRELDGSKQRAVHPVLLRRRACHPYCSSIYISGEEAHHEKNRGSKFIWCNLRHS